MGKINIYGWGDEGVDLVASPVHAKDGSFQRLQNAEFSNIQGEGGVKKRGSLTRLNASPLNAGANLLALFNMPLETLAFDSAGPETLYMEIAPDVLGDPAWEGSTDGSTFTPSAAMIQPTGGVGLNATSVTDNGVLYFAAASATLWSWDGTTLTQAPAFPADPGDATAAINTISVTALSGVIYVSVRYAGGNLRVYAWIPGALSYTQVGDVVITAGDSGLLTSALGLLWLFQATVSGGSAKIYRIDPVSAAVWTLDHTFSGTSTTGTAICTFLGTVIVATFSTPDKTGILWQASTPGTWTAQHTFTGITSAPLLRELIPHDDDETVIAVLIPDGGVGLEAWVSDTGISWSLDFNLASLGSSNAGRGVVFGSTHYLTQPDTNGDVPFNGQLVRRVAGSLWEAVVTAAPIGVGLGVTGGV